jgi:organic radical activating enzyme
MDQVKVIENFVTWQGEGCDAGRRVILLRFKTCNLSCKFCDTAVKMRITAEASHSLKDIQKQIDDNFAGLLITGGEPTVRRHLNETIALLNKLRYPFANVETNGYDLIKLIEDVNPEKNVKYIYSPKIENSEDFDTHIDITKQLIDNPNVYFKLLKYSDDEYLERYLLSLLVHSESMDINIRRDGRVWLMPEGGDFNTLLKNSPEVFDLCEKYHLSFSSRNHIVFGFI